MSPNVDFHVSTVAANCWTLPCVKSVQAAISLSVMAVFAFVSRAGDGDALKRSSGVPGGAARRGRLVSLRGLRPRLVGFEREDVDLAALRRFGGGLPEGLPETSLPWDRALAFGLGLRDSDATRFLDAAEENSRRNFCAARIAF